MPRTTFGELRQLGALEFGDGYRTKRSELDVSGYRIIRVADISDNEVHIDGPDFVDRAYSKEIGTKLSRAGDVLLTTKGTVGRVAIYPAGAEQAVYSPQLCYFRATDAAVIHPRFLALWFKSADFAEQANQRANNTDMAAYLNLRDINSLAIDLPKVNEQKAIADVLGSLDDKIAASSALAQKADGLAAATYELAATAAAPLSSLARFVNGKAFTKGASGTGRVVVRISELNSGLGGSTVYSDAVVGDDHVARPGDLLFAWSGSLTAARWFRPDAIINQHIFKVVADRGWPLWVVHQALLTKLTDFKATAADKATTMGHIQRHHLDEPVAVPDAASLQRIDSLMSALWQTALAAEVQGERLAATRDELLPLLMSGRITVREAEQVAETAS